MIEVKLSLSRGKIALVYSVPAQKELAFSFSPRKSQDVIHQIFSEKGVKFNSIRIDLTLSECEELAKNIIRAKTQINMHRAGEITVESFFCNTKERWMIKFSNCFSKQRLLSPEICNSLIVELKRHKVLRFEDSTTVQLSPQQMEAFISKLNSTKEIVNKLNRPVTVAKPWLRETIVLSES